MAGTTETILGSPSPEEMTFLALNQGNYDPAIAGVFEGLQNGDSPHMLSVLRPDLAVGLSERLWPLVAGNPITLQDGYKADLFDRTVLGAIEGDPAAISALPKFATSVGELALAVELMLDNRGAVAEWHEGRPFVQFIGSFNPQHIGHRATIRSTLLAAGENSSGIVQVVQNHPIKKDSLPPYRGRFVAGEERLYNSRLLDPQRVTQLDVPLGLGLAKQGTAQIELLASAFGDDELRWLVGSDKFLTDARNVQAGKALDKAGARFADKRVHLYVARRTDHSPEELAEAVDYIRDRYDTSITMVPESPEPGVLEAAASKIRAFRAEGRHEEADRMEFADIISRS